MAKAIWDTNEQNKLATQISQKNLLFPKKKIIALKSFHPSTVPTY